MAVPNDLRQINRRKVVLASRRGKTTTRSALAKLTGISQATIGKIVDELIEDGVLRDVGRQPVTTSGPGRPGTPIKLDDVRPKFLAIELGVTHTRIAMLTAAPPQRDHWTTIIPTIRDINQWVASVAKAAAPLLRNPLAAILVSIPGILDTATGRSILAPNSRWIEGESIAARLTAAIHLDTYPIQEIACLALGHYTTNPAAGDFLLVDFGMGVGSAAMVSGHLMRGPLPFSNELGHTPVLGNSAFCGCGGIGCLETLVGREYFVGRAEVPSKPTKANERTPTHCPDSDPLTPAELARLTSAAQAGRVHGALAAAGLGIAGALNVLGLNHVIISGFMSGLPPDLFNILRSNISSAALAGRFGPVQVDAAQRHRLAGLAAFGMDRVLAPP